MALEALLQTQMQLRSSWSVGDIFKVIQGLVSAGVAADVHATAVYVGFLAGNLSAMGLKDAQNVLNVFLLLLAPTDPRIDQALERYCQLC